MNMTYKESLEKAYNIKNWKWEYTVDVAKKDNDFGIYFQVIRVKDEAILYANESIDNIKIFCFDNGIHKDNIIWL